MGQKYLALNNPFRCLFTLGYTVADAAAVLEQYMCDYPQAFVIDTRYRPASRYRPMWNKGALQARWGTCYRHERRLGNLNYRVPGAPILLVDAEGVIETLAQLVRDGQPLVLLCACANYETCHRKVIVDLVRQRLEGN